MLIVNIPPLLALLLSVVILGRVIMLGKNNRSDSTGGNDFCNNSICNNSFSIYNALANGCFCLKWLVVSACVLGAIACGGPSSSGSSGGVGLSTSSSSTSSGSSSTSGSAFSSSSSSSSSSTSSSSGDMVTAKPATLDVGAWFVLVNRASGLALSVDGAEVGASLVQSVNDHASNQQFRFVQYGDDYYGFVARHSRFSLNLFDGNTAEAADIVQAEIADIHSQHFQLLELGDGYYRIVNRLSNFALMPESSANTEGVRITQYAQSDTWAQQWQMVEVEKYSTGVFNPCPVPPEVCKIMPSGDSITMGAQSSNTGGYRVPLFRQAVLQDNKLMTFVGPSGAGPSTVDGVSFPENHDGHSGYIIDTIGSRKGLFPLIASNMNKLKPHIVLLMIGTNDINANLELGTAPDRVAKVIDEFTTLGPDTLIVVGLVIPTQDDDLNTKTQAFNKELINIVNKRIDQGKHLILVDMYSVFAVNNNYKSDWLYDRWHPNNEGYRVMAGSWYEVIQGFLY